MGASKKIYMILLLGLYSHQLTKAVYDVRYMRMIIKGHLFVNQPSHGDHHGVTAGNYVRRFNNRFWILLRL